jgi:hypothetical protein
MSGSCNSDSLGMKLYTDKESGKLGSAVPQIPASLTLT